MMGISNETRKECSHSGNGGRGKKRITGSSSIKSVIRAAESLGAYRRERYVFLTREKSSYISQNLVLK
jgi:hypothetical protein